MVLFEFEEEDLLSVGDSVFDAVRFGDEWSKDLSWEESILLRTGSEQSISGLVNISESPEGDLRKLSSDLFKEVYKGGSKASVEDCFSRDLELRTSMLQSSGPNSAPSNNPPFPAVYSEESLKSCLKTDVQGRKHYHGLYALDMVEKSFSLSPPAGLWTNTAHSKLSEDESFLFNESFSTDSLQQSEEAQLSNPLNSREFSSMIFSPSLPFSSPLKRFKNAAGYPTVVSSKGFIVPKTVSGLASDENCVERFPMESEMDSSSHSGCADLSGRYRKFRVPDPILSPTLESQIKRRPQRKKQYSRASPAKFCHLCARASSKNVRMVVCSNIHIGMCLKVTCEKCFQQNSWNFEEAFEKPESWICTHCRGSCPYRAQCSIYQRTNHRRRVSRFLMRKQKELNEGYE